MGMFQVTVDEFVRQCEAIGESELAASTREQVEHHYCQRHGSALPMVSACDGESGAAFHIVCGLCWPRLGGFEITKPTPEASRG